MFLELVGTFSGAEVEFVASQGDSGNLTTYTFNSVSFGAADPTREIFVVFNSGVAAARTVSSVTIGGVAATVCASAFSSASSRLSCAFAAVPTGATGSIVITYSGQAQNCTIGVYRVVNRINKGADTTDFDSNSSGTNVTTLGMSGCTVKQYGFILSTLIKSSTGVATVTGGAGITKDADPAADGFAKPKCSTPIQQAETTPTITYNWTTAGTVAIAAWAFN